MAHRKDDQRLSVALVVGPNYNLPMMAEPRAEVAWEALQQAKPTPLISPQWSRH